MNEISMRIPEIRFAEFKDEWNQGTLGKVSNNIMYGMNSAAILYDGENKYIRITDIDEKSRQFKPQPLSSPSGQIEARYKLKSGDIVFARTGASVGKSYIYNENDGNLYFAGFLIRFSITQAEPYFIYSQTLSTNYCKWVKIMSMRSGQPGINSEEYKKLPISIPSLPEQEKIADFLSTVDAKISALKKKKELLELYKKGLMQKIFSREIRFRDDNGEDFPEWEEKRLGDCLNYIQPTKYLVESTEYDNTFCIPVLTAGKTFILGYTDEKKGIFKNNLPVIVFDDFTTSMQFVDFPFKVKSSAIKILVARNNYNIKFIFEAMKFINYEIGGHERHWISKYSHLFIGMPKKEEQDQIACYINDLDKKIEIIQSKIDFTEQWKKGLLQKMFV